MSECGRTFIDELPGQGMGCQEAVVIKAGGTVDNHL